MKLRLFFHLLAQILAQGAVFELVPVHYKPVFVAVVAVVGVFVAFFDNQTPTVAK